MLPLQLVLRPERAQSAWPSPPRALAMKRRNSASSPIRRASPRLSRSPLVLCPVQQPYRSPPTPKTCPRRRSRHLAIHHDTWLAIERVGSSVVGLPRVCINLLEAVVSTATSMARTVIVTASTMLMRWWSGLEEDNSSALEVVERQLEDPHHLDDIVEENTRLKRMLEFAMTSHVIMNEATSMLEDGADLWIKRAEDVVEAKVQEAKAERDALALQLEGLQEQLGDKDQEIERLRATSVRTPC